MAKKKTIKKSYVRPAQVVREVTREDGGVRPVFYVRREMLHDERGRSCLTPLELGSILAEALGRRDVQTVQLLCYDALSFVHNGSPPGDWAKEPASWGATPLAI